MQEAQERIEELHPLAELPLARVFPMWACCLRPCAKERKRRVSFNSKRSEEFKRLKRAGESLGVVIEEPRLGAADAKEPFSDPNENPYMSLGFGMVAYFGMLRALIFMFAIFTLIAVPIISVYASYSGLEQGNNYSKTKYSLGNLGFTEYLCKHIFIGNGGEFQFQCRTGTVGKFYKAGILPANNKVENVFGDYMGFCADPTAYPEVATCQAAIDTEHIKSYFNENCKGNKKCGPKALKMNSSGTEKGFLNHKPAGASEALANCFNVDSLVYIQYECQ